MKSGLHRLDNSSPSRSSDLRVKALGWSDNATQTIIYTASKSSLELRIDRKGYTAEKEGKHAPLSNISLGRRYGSNQRLATGRKPPDTSL